MIGANLGRIARSTRRLVFLAAVAMLPLVVEATAQELPVGLAPHLTAQRLLYAGKVTEAIRVWGNGLQRDADNLEMLTALGAVLAADGQFSQAVPHLRRAAGLAKENWPLRLFLGSVLEAAGQKLEARIEFNAIVALASNKGTIQIARDRLAGSYAKDQKALETQTWSKLGGQREPGPFWAGELVGVPWARPDSTLHDDGAVVPFITVALLIRQPSITGGDYVDIYGAVGARVVSYAKNRFLVTSWTWRAMPDEKNPAAVRQALAQLEFVRDHVRACLAGSNAECRPALEKKLEATPAAEQGKLDEAADRLKTVLRLNPDDAQARSMLGRVYERQGRLDEAERELNVALGRWPDYPNAIYGLGLTALKQGRYADAVRLFSRVIELKPTLEEPYFARADAYARLPRFDQGEAFGFAANLVANQARNDLRFAVPTPRTSP